MAGATSERGEATCEREIDLRGKEGNRSQHDYGGSFEYFDEKS